MCGPRKNPFTGQILAFFSPKNRFQRNRRQNFFTGCAAQVFFCQKKLQQLCSAIDFSEKKFARLNSTTRFSEKKLKQLCSAADFSEKKFVRLCKPIHGANFGLF
jgi:hypothetical protein